MFRPSLVIAFLLITVTASAAETEKVRAELQKRLDYVKVKQVVPSPIPGLFQASLEGKMVYVSQDGRYLMEGSMFDLESGKNLTTMAVLDTIEDKDTIIFSPKKPIHTLTVFTDTSCGYCRKLHQDVPALNEKGIKVRYLLFPRAGPDSDTGAIMQSVWCSDNPQEALTTAKSGGEIPEKKCDNPINRHLELGQQLGVRGTPMLLTDSGRIIPGYKPVDQLIADFDSTR